MSDRNVDHLIPTDEKVAEMAKDIAAELSWMDDLDLSKINIDIDWL